jgi:hypothetical protein
MSERATRWRFKPLAALAVCLPGLKWGSCASELGGAGVNSPERYAGRLDPDRLEPGLRRGGSRSRARRPQALGCPRQECDMLVGFGLGVVVFGS